MCHFLSGAVQYEPRLIVYVRQSFTSEPPPLVRDYACKVEAQSLSNHLSHKYTLTRRGR